MNFIRLSFNEFYRYLSIFLKSPFTADDMPLKFAACESEPCRIERLNRVLRTIDVYTYIHIACIKRRSSSKADRKRNDAASRLRSISLVSRRGRTRRREGNTGSRHRPARCSCRDRKTQSRVPRERRRPRARRACLLINPGTRDSGIGASLNQRGVFAGRCDAREGVKTPAALTTLHLRSLLSAILERDRDREKKRGRVIWRREGGED